ncbi:MAG TPA: hypothetical protein VF517_15010 [Thermoleophilaceae bacterium]|jgi:hypothetical protein
MALDYTRLDHKTVAWATENARELVKEEADRLRALDAKSAQLVGFAGVILAVLGSLGKDAFLRDLGYVGDPLFAAAYFLSMLVLTASILWLVFFTLKPQRLVVIDAKELSAYLEDERLLQAEAAALQIRTLRALRDAASWAQRVGKQKASRLSTGMALFAIGLAAALVAVTTMGAGSLG